MQARGKQELDREAEQHIALGVLLRKKRSPEKRAAVRKLLESDLSPARLIEEIRRVDASAERASLAAPKSGARGEGGSIRAPFGEEVDRIDAGEGASPTEAAALEPARAPRRPVGPYRIGIAKLKNVLKTPVLRAPFLRYLFREFSRILGYGRASHVFAPVLLVPRLRLDPGVKAFFGDSLKSWNAELLSYLGPVLQIGWKHLPKTTYNMIAALELLCREIDSFNTVQLEERDASLVDRFKTLETMFFSFHYRPGTVEETIKSMASVMRQEHALSARHQRAELLLSRILLKDYTMPSLYNVLLGLNMMKLRRYLAVPDLLSPDLGELFEKTEFACSPEVQALIDAYLVEAKDRITRIHNQWMQTKRWKDLAGDGAVTESTLLRDVYEVADGAAEHLSFAEDRDNVVALAPVFFRRYDSTFSSLLSGKITIAGPTRVQIFNEQFFRSELDRIRLTISKIERHAVSFRTFPFQRYLSIRREGKPSVAAEAEIIRDLQVALDAYVAIGKRLAQVLALSRSAVPDNHAQRPLDASTLLMSKPIEIPRAGEVIAARGMLNGKEIGEAIGLAASAAFQAAVLFYDRSFIGEIAAETSLRAQIDANLETVRRIADDETFDGFTAALLL